MGKFRQIMIELSAHDMKMAWYYHFTFLFITCEPGLSKICPSNQDFDLVLQLT